MSVIVRELGSKNMIAFTKGAPEKIIEICEESSVPSDFFLHLSKYTAQGYRVIALAYKKLPSKFKWKDAQVVKRNHVNKII